MPYPIQSLIQGKNPPRCVEKSTTVIEALSIMIENDYSQIPVLDKDGYPVGMVNYESILNAIKNFGATLEDLVVTNALEHIEVVSIEDDLFDVLNRVRDANAVLIAIQGEPIGIFTSYDANEYFRKRAEDLMYIEDIETMIKEFVLAYFSDDEGELNDSALGEAILAVTDQEKEWEGRYRGALNAYLDGIDDGNIDQVKFQESFKSLYKSPDPKPFDELDLFVYIELLLNAGRWEFYSPFLNIKPNHLRGLLSKVRETRNDLAHFRGEVTQNRRREILHCHRLLNQAKIEFDKSIEDRLLQSLLKQETVHIQGSSDVVQEEPDSMSSRYAPLAIWLQNQLGTLDRVRLSFDDIAEIIEADLPPSAYTHRAWWANDSVRHSHSILWLDAGWRVASVNMGARQVTFARIKERERAYIKFWAELFTRLGEGTELPYRKASPDGTSWILVLPLPENGSVQLLVNFAFSQNNRFRIELYIDTGDKEKNKEIFDLLFSQKTEIELGIGEGLSWERLDHRRASRIAVYHAGNIQNEQDELEKLMQWVEKTVVPFYYTLAPITSRLP